MGKRVLLFILTNIMVMVTLSVVTSVLGVHTYLAAQGIDYQALAIFCAIWGTGGAFISLGISKWMAKTAMGVQVIDPQTLAEPQRSLVSMVHSLAQKAGLKTMPEVGIYDSPEVNAFATGPSRSNALVAVSSGLLARFEQREVEGVLGHEVAHIANGDMVTMTLLQGIVNAFAMFLSRIAAYALSMVLSRNQEDEQPSTLVFSLLTMVFDLVFTFLGSMVVAAFSRYREYRADAGGAQLAGKTQMLSALRRLQLQTGVEDQRAPALAALKINHQSGWLAWLATHPTLEMRIARLQQAQG